MKKTILILLAALLALPLAAQSRYSVYKTKGTVRVCPKAESAWADATRNRELQLGDRLQLADNAAVTIFDSSNSLLYTYETPGECTVMEAVRSVRDKAGSRTGAVNAEMKRSIESHGSDPGYGVLGASFRGSGEASFTDSLSVSLRMLAGTANANAQLALTQAQLGVSQAVYNFVVAKAGLEGTLGADFIDDQGNVQLNKTYSNE